MRIYEGGREMSRYRPYNYDENLIRENSRKRKNRKQLCFSDEEIELINANMAKLGISNFSLYMRATACYLATTKEEIDALGERVL